MYLIAYFNLLAFERIDCLYYVCLRRHKLIKCIDTFVRVLPHMCTVPELQSNWCNIIYSYSDSYALIDAMRGREHPSCVHQGACAAHTSRLPVPQRHLPGPTMRSCILSTDSPTSARGHYWTAAYRCHEWREGRQSRSCR